MSEAPPDDAFPSIAQYDEAMLHPRSYLRVPDSDLREGHVLLADRQNAFGVEQEPWKNSGAFAVVYKFCKAPGREARDGLVALRCFTSSVCADVAERYALLGPYLRVEAQDVTAKTDFFPAGVTVRMADNSFRAYPLLIMDWVDGITLGQALDRYCRADDRAGVDRLFLAWISLLYCLYDARIAHGDLAAGNLIVGTGDQLILIDYDGCFIPALAGRSATVNGQPDYQHPHTGQRNFDERMDDFSALLIGTALLALRAEPALWQRFAGRGGNGEWQGEHLLFTQQDLRAPEVSPVFQAIEELGDRATQAAVRALRQACRQPLEETPVALTILDAEFPLRQALKVLRRASDDGDAEAMLAAWSPALDHYAPAQPYRAGVVQARERAAAFGTLRAALDSDDDHRILEAAATLPLEMNVPPGAATRINLASRRAGMLGRLRLALQGTDDSAVADAWDETIPLPASALAPQEVERVRQALQGRRVTRDIDGLLARGSIEGALRCALSARLRSPNTSLLAAQRRFLATQQPTAASARRSGDVIEVRWTWPPSPLIDTVAVVLSRVAPPGRLHYAGEQAMHVTRAEYQQRGGFRATVAGKEPVFIQLLAALPAMGQSDGDNKWAYSDARPTGSRAVAREVCRVRCRLLKRRGSPRNALELRTLDGRPLPDLVVVRAVGLLPLTPNEGVPLFHYSERAAAGRALFEFDARSWPARSVLRVFPIDPADEPWVQIDGQHGIRLDVT